MTVIDRSRASRISTRAAELRLTSMLLSLLALPLVALGWVAYRAVAVTRWVVAAIVTGYVEARESARVG